MKRLDVFSLFDLGTRVGALNRVMEDTPIKPWPLYQYLQHSDRILEHLLTQPSLPATGEAAELHRAIKEAMATHFLEFTNEGPRFKEGLDTAVIEPRNLTRLRNAMNAFWYVFNADCRHLEAYEVEGIAGLNVSDLLHRGRIRIHESIHPLVPSQALEEMDHAGRCLALECNTAAGFHALRAIEVMIDSYVRACGGKKPEYKSWNDYVVALEKLEKDAGSSGVRPPSPKVKARLLDLKNLDRNPLMHPRENLDVKGADRLFDLAKLTITEMAEHLSQIGPHAVTGKDNKPAVES